MKKIFSILLVGFLSFVHVSVLAQDLNGFKSIYVIEPTYEDGRTDIWGIAPIVRDVFQKKGFSIVTPQMMQNPNFQEELFSMLRCEIFHTQDNWTGATVVLKNLSASAVNNATLTVNVLYLLTADRKT